MTFNSEQLIDPIEHRFKEEEERVQASKDLLKTIADNRTAAESLPPPRKNAVCFSITNISLTKLAINITY